MQNLILVLATSLFMSSAWAVDYAEIHQYLKDFHANPASQMEKKPQLIVDGKAIDRGSINIEEIRVNRTPHIPLRRESVTIPGLFSAPLPNDLAVGIVDGTLISNIATMDSMRLTSGAVNTIPWADSYWPVYKGMLGHRYADPSFPESKDFNTNYQYFLANPPGNIASWGDPGAIDRLSPAEKYDLLVGDSNWTLTNHSWAEGQSYIARSGFVPLWVGICHGWAAAAHMDIPISRAPITVYSVNNIPITFHQSDIKALQSMIWANGSPATRFVGSKCLVSKPQRNSVGRIIEPTCLDSNPATFHMVMTNQLGRNKRSFVMDGTYDAEIWNFPLSAYTYRYFNPQTLQPTTDYRQAIIPIENFTSDKFKEFRAPGTRYLVGIVMDDTYVIEISPNRGNQDTHPTKTVRHYYDLELDGNFEIIGGEWYANAHPDFIWSYAPDAKARSIGDNQVNSAEWIANVPTHWTEPARRASARGQPLLAVIEGLLARETARQ